MGKQGPIQPGGAGNAGIVPGLSHSRPSQPLRLGIIFGNGRKPRLAPPEVELQQPGRDPALTPSLDLLLAGIREGVEVRIVPQTERFQQEGERKQAGNSVG